jgi:AbrB family looped-hinge helix DNA binding protein
MRATIDKAGRLVIPKQLRKQLGLIPGPVEVDVHGASLRVVPITDDTLVQEEDFLVIPTGSPISDEDVRALRDADQR